MAIDKDKRIQELEATVAQLMAEVAELKRRLGMTSANSSKPPSSDPPGANTNHEQTPKGRRKKRGAKKGHPKQNKKLLPEEEVTKLVELLPEVCPACGQGQTRGGGGAGIGAWRGKYLHH